MTQLKLTDLDAFKATKGFPVGYPENVRVFYSPVDRPKEAVALVLRSAVESIVGGMYGYDDVELDAIIHAKALHTKLTDPEVYVQMSLDSSQAAGAAEKAILATWEHDKIGNSISIGRSEKGAIMHQKDFCVDGRFLITGSMNWSTSGETKQDNVLYIICDPLVVAAATARLNIIHDFQLKAMAAKKVA